MTGERIKKWLETKGDLKSISPANLSKLEAQDQMIVVMIQEALGGSYSCFKTLHDLAYGILKPGEGPSLGEDDSGTSFEVDFNLPDEQ